jgi:hypothetical protein
MFLTFEIGLLFFQNPRARRLTAASSSPNSRIRHIIITVLRKKKHEVGSKNAWE